MVAVDRVQTGVRLERRLLKVLKGLAEYLDLTLGDLLEGIALHAFEQKLPFDDATVAAIETLKKVYALDLTAADSHRLSDAHRPRSAQAPPAQAPPAQARVLETRPAKGGGPDR